VVASGEAARVTLLIRYWRKVVERNKGGDVTVMPLMKRVGIDVRVGDGPSVQELPKMRLILIFCFQQINNGIIKNDKILKG
jgi:hypothetical protein